MMAPSVMSTNTCQGYTARESAIGSGITWEQVDALHPMSLGSGRITCCSGLGAAVTAGGSPNISKTATTNLLELTHLEQPIVERRIVECRIRINDRLSMEFSRRWRGDA
jgi:hypothetical protein